MMYGLWLSAGGLLASSARQDVIANNLANAETVGFKRDLVLQQQRRMATEEHPLWQQYSDPMMNELGGGTMLAPSAIDTSQGEIETTGNNLDVALQGKGFYAVSNGSKTSLTRDGQFLVDRNGDLVMSNNGSAHVLDGKLQPIHFDSLEPVSIDKDGNISQSKKSVGQLGVFDVADHRQLTKDGQLLIGYGRQALNSVSATIRSGFVERSNVDPATEMTQLMATQRELEANANMIRCQDQALGLLVNTVGKVS